MYEESQQKFFEDNIFYCKILAINLVSGS